MALLMAPKAKKLTIIFVTMGQGAEEFKWANSRMRAHKLRTDNMMFIGTMFTLYFIK
jgi:hypothetical protein